MSSSIEFQINGRLFSATKDRTIIEVADQHGIYVPRFCYHKKLSVVANCRMCLVEVEGLPRPVPACATLIMPNMHVLTRSAKTKAAQQAVMEFLLINHPLDCPICDQGGQCELQDLAMQYGRDDSVFAESKRAVENPELGSLIATEMTRCIQCTRCVRFGSEVSGQMELGAVKRGENTQITNYVKKPLQSELSGNMIDVCPVGALTSKPFQFKARAWEISSIAHIAPHDCLGSHIYLHVHDQQVVRVVPRENDNINEVWLSDRDRYGYLGINSAQRLTQPMIKVEGTWQPTDWPTALYETAEALKRVIRQEGAGAIGGLISPSATLEEMYLFRQLCHGLGTANIDHRLHEIDTRDQYTQQPYSDIAISELNHCDVIVLIGSNIQREQPLLTVRLRQVVAQGGIVISINCIDYPFPFEVAHKVIVSPEQLAVQVAALVQCSAAVADEKNQSSELDCIARRLHAAKKAAILLGAVSRNHPHAATIRHWVEQLKALTQAKVMHLTEGANARGAWIVGAVPLLCAHQKPLPLVALSAYEMLQRRLRAYLLFNLEPSLDMANPCDAKAAMEAADCVIAFSAFTSPDLLKQASILLPIHCFAENEGTFVNLEGKWQSFSKVLPPQGESKEGWELLKDLAAALTMDMGSYTTIAAVRDAIKSEYTGLKKSTEQAVDVSAVESLNAPKKALWRITEWALYSIDPLLRHSQALQHSGAQEKTGAYLNENCAKHFNLKLGQLVRLKQKGHVSSAAVAVIIDNRVPDNCVWTPAGRYEVSDLGASFGPVELMTGETESVQL